MRRHATIVGRQAILLAIVQMTLFATCVMYRGMSPDSVPSPTSSETGETEASAVVVVADVVVVVVIEMLCAGTVSNLAI